MDHGRGSGPRQHQNLPGPRVDCSVQIDEEETGDPEEGRDPDTAWEGHTVRIKQEVDRPLTSVICVLLVTAGKS